MAMFEIKSRYDGKVIFRAECGSLKLCVELAVKSGANLSSANLSSANLSSADLSSANLSSADLSSANLSGANLSGANLSGANLSSANLYCANLYCANLYCANLTGATYGEGIPIGYVPLMLQGTKYFILVMDTHIKIGCKLYKHTEWESFTDAEISDMDSGALEWWKEWKGFVLSLSLGHQQRIAKK